MRDQYSFVLSALKEMAGGRYPLWNANRFVISLFTHKDLHRARNPTPPCMTQISFHPVKGDLSLIATFRAQYTDAKGFGNLYSLAELLRRTASETGFDPAQLYSVA